MGKILRRLPGIFAGPFHLLLLGCLLSCLALSSSALALEAVVLETLPEDYRSLELLIQPGKSPKTVELITAKGEGEPFVLALSGMREKTFSVKVKGLPEAGWARCSLYRVGWVDVQKGRKEGFRKADPLFPVALDSTVTSPDDPTLLWVRLTVAPDAPSVDKLELTVHISSGTQTAEIPVHVKIAPLTLPNDLPLTIQAALRKAEDREDKAFSQSEILDAYTFLSDYGINAAAVGSKAIKTGKSSALYEDLLTKAGMKKVRIEFLNTKKVFRKQKNTKPLDDGLSEMKQSIKQNMEQDRDLVQKYPNALIVKLWDEPRRNEYPVLKELSDYVRSFHLPVLIDVTGSSVEELKNYASIFVPRLQELELPAIRQVQAEGKQVWFYANPMHSLLNPYHTMRNIGWLLWGLRLDGYHIWSVNDWEASPYAMKFSTENAFGRGLFVYPGTSSKIFNPSIRLEMVREGLEDYKIMRTISQSKKLPCAETSLNKYLQENYGYEPGEKRYLNNPKPMHDQLLQYILRGSC